MTLRRVRPHRSKPRKLRVAAVTVESLVESFGCATYSGDSLRPFGVVVARPLRSPPRDSRKGLGLKKRKTVLKPESPAVCVSAIYDRFSPSSIYDRFSPSSSDGGHELGRVWGNYGLGSWSPTLSPGKGEKMGHGRFFGRYGPELAAAWSSLVMWTVDWVSATVPSFTCTATGL